MGKEIVEQRKFAKFVPYRTKDVDPGYTAEYGRTIKVNVTEGAWKTDEGESLVNYTEKHATKVTVSVIKGEADHAYKVRVVERDLYVSDESTGEPKVISETNYTGKDINVRVPNSNPFTSSTLVWKDESSPSPKHKLEKKSPLVSFVRRIVQPQ